MTIKIIPEAVVVDTRDGFTWSTSASGAPFSTEAAIAWVKERHQALKPEHRTLEVFVLSEKPEKTEKEDVDV